MPIMGTKCKLEHINKWICQCKFLEQGVVGPKGAFGEVLLFWDNGILELPDMELGEFSISCSFKNWEDGFV